MAHSEYIAQMLQAQLLKNFIVSGTGRRRMVASICNAIDRTGEGITFPSMLTMEGCMFIEESLTEILSHAADLTFDEDGKEVPGRRFISAFRHFCRSKGGAVWSNIEDTFCAGLQKAQKWSELDEKRRRLDRETPEGRDRTAKRLPIILKTACTRAQNDLNRLNAQVARLLDTVGGDSSLLSNQSDAASHYADLCHRVKRCERRLLAAQRKKADYDAEIAAAAAAVEQTETSGPMEVD